MWMIHHSIKRVKLNLETHVNIINMRKKIVIKMIKNENNLVKKGQTKSKKNVDKMKRINNTTLSAHVRY